MKKILIATSVLLSFSAFSMEVTKSQKYYMHGKDCTEANRKIADKVASMDNVGRVKLSKCVVLNNNLATQEATVEIMVDGIIGNF